MSIARYPNRPRSFPSPTRGVSRRTDMSNTTLSLLSAPRGIAAGRQTFCRVLAVLGDDSIAVAHAASELAHLHRSRLSLVQTWTAPATLCGLGHPSLLSLNLSRADVLNQLAATADAHVRAIVRELTYSGREPSSRPASCAAERLPSGVNQAEKRHRPIAPRRGVVRVSAPIGEATHCGWVGGRCARCP
jgi:hypothetical protein